MDLATLASLIKIYVTVDCNFDPQNASQTWTFASPAKNMVKKIKRRRRSEDQNDTPDIHEIMETSRRMLNKLQSGINWFVEVCGGDGISPLTELV